MARYFVSAKTNGNGTHEVHAAKCGHPATNGYRIHLGDFKDCRDAVEAAKEHYVDSEGCRLCCRACYTESTGRASDSARRGVPLPLSSFGG